jgi:hypothetical protein
VLKTVTVHPTKLDLEIFELEEFRPGSQNREEWLRGLDSNQDNQLQRLACYQLHYPGLARESLADLRITISVCRSAADLLRFQSPLPRRGVRAV